MRLAEFILANIEPILIEWEAFAKSLLPGADMTIAALRDDAGSILLATANDMQNQQSAGEQASKSKGDGGAASIASDKLDHASELHGAERLHSGFHITDVVAEYRALRASVLRLWRQSRPQPGAHDLDDITRFSESLDQSIARGVDSYARGIDASRHMFLAILGHDLRNPLSVIQMTALRVSGRSKEPATDDAMQMIRRSANTMVQLISDLIDFSSSGLGREIPLHRAPLDLQDLCHEVVESFRTLYPGRVVRLHTEGDLNGVCDAARMRQVISNLVGNAIQHGSPDSSIDLSVFGTKTSSTDLGSSGDELIVSVHNDGAPIPPEILPSIFDPLKRYATPESAERHTPGSIGLGLYIVREIVKAKKGAVTVSSNAAEGTTFTVRVPRLLPLEEREQA